MPYIGLNKTEFGTFKVGWLGKGLFVKKRLQSHKASHWLSCYSPSAEGARGGSEI